MNKFMKGFITVCLAVCMAVCLGLAVACTDTPTKVTSCTVTVKLADGSPAVGISVQVCAMNGETTGCKLPVNTDANGVAVADVETYLNGGTTLFEVHLLNVPDGYAYVDANGKEYEEGKGVSIDTSKGYTAEITLSEKKTDSPVILPVSHAVTLASATATQTVTPEITVPGLYEVRSISAFTVSGNGFSLTAGYYNVLIYLEVGDSLTFGTVSDLEYDVSFVYSTADGKTTPVTTTRAGAIVVKLGASETFNVNHPESGIGGTTNSPVIVGGANFTATLSGHTYTDGFAVAAGRNFSVKAVNAANYVVIEFSSPVSYSALTLGESKTFSIDLINTYNGTSESLQWITREYILAFTTGEAGDYKVTVSSEFDGDILFIAQVGSEYHYPDATLKSEDGGKTYYAVYNLRENETYRAYIFSDSTFEGKSEGDTLTYTALVEKEEVYDNV